MSLSGGDVGSKISIGRAQSGNVAPNLSDGLLNLRVCVTSARDLA